MKVIEKLIKNSNSLGSQIFAPSIKQKQINNFDQKDFKFIGNYAKDYLKVNIQTIELHKNESGFIRMGIPLNQQITGLYPMLKKLRVHFWSNKLKLNIQEESIHTHPNKFETFIVQGGYSHAIYEEQQLNIKEAEYSKIRIKKDGNIKIPMTIGKTNLVTKKVEFVSAGEIKVFDKKLLHKVLQTIPNTVSINTLIENNNDDKQTHKYDVFLSKNASIEKDIKTFRDQIQIKQTDKLALIDEVITSLAKNY